MRELLNKSKLNKEAAELLNVQFKYAPSVHCSYYSFLQHATCVLSNVFGKTIDQIRIDHMNGNKRPGRHEAILLEFIDQMEIKGYLKINEFIAEFEDVKQLRVRSDYQNQSIKERHAIKALELRQKLINHLNNIS